MDRSNPSGVETVPELQINCNIERLKAIVSALDKLQTEKATLIQVSIYGKTSYIDDEGTESGRATGEMNSAMIFYTDAKGQSFDMSFED